MKFYLKTYKAESQFIVSVCDENILGKCFREDKKVLDLKKYENYYKGSKVELEDIEKIIDKATILNLVGKEIIDQALKNKWCDREKILYIDGIPHIQVYKIQL